MTQGGESVSFDRAAGYYDATRRLSPQASAAQAAQLRAALRDVDGPVLEIGVGTGRVALPLVAAGQRLVGVDISSAMLATLRDKAPGALPLVQADASRLPFRDGVFGGAVVAHVLHLVADWRAVVAELRRVVRPGGVLLVTRGAASNGLQAEIQRRFRARAGWTMPPGRLDSLTRLDELIESAGGTAMTLPPIPTEDSSGAEDRLGSIEANLYSWTWDVADDIRLSAAREVREWVTSTYGDPATVMIESAPIEWRHYRLPGGNPDRPPTAGTRTAAPDHPPDRPGRAPVIDAHQHCWDPHKVAYDWLGREFAPIDTVMPFDELAPQLEAAGVDFTVLVQSADSRADTDFMFGVAAAEPRVAGIVGWVPLDRPDVADRHLDELTSRPGFVGVRSLIHNQDDPDWLLRPEVDDGLRLLARRGLTFDLVSVLPRHLEHVPVLSRRHPELRIVVDHLSKPPLDSGSERFRQWRALIVEAARNPLVHAKVSGLYPTEGDPSAWSVDEIRPAFETAVEAFGVQRLMFGGDWPISVLAGGYARVWAGLSELFAGLTADERESILGRTAASFYRIPAERLGAKTSATRGQ